MKTSTLSRLVAIVGRPNVGKSTLFNRLIGNRKSLVNDEPGVTRDRIFARARYENEDFFLCDTGGFEPTSKDNIKRQLVEQAEVAIEEAALVVFLADGREGLHPIDAELVKRLRRAGKTFIVAVNKCDLARDDLRTEDFRSLGAPHLLPVSAEHGRGVELLLATISQFLDTQPRLPIEDTRDEIRLAIVGRPNVGKSSILNRLVGETRSIVDNKPGTTRDTVDVLLRYFGRELRIVDTAGIRRKSRMVDKLEQFSALRSMSAIEDADVAVLVIDAEEGPTEGDARVAGFAFELRKPILIVINKWDLIENKTSKSAQEYEESIRYALRYIRYAPIVFVSAETNQRVSKILPEALALYDQSSQRVSTSVVNNVLREVLVKHTPPLTKSRSKKINFSYATQVGVLPPRFVIFCSHPQDVHFSYKRFLENEFREAFGFQNIPIALVLRRKGESRDRLDTDAPPAGAPREDRFESEPATPSV